MAETWGAQALTVVCGRGFRKALGRGRGRLVALGLAVGLMLVLAPAALALTPSVDIQSSAGPLTDIWIGNDLSCEVLHLSNTGAEFYPAGTGPADCGTFLASGGTLFGPDFGNHAGTATDAVFSAGNGETVVTPVSQTAVAGLGTSGSPFKVTTVATAGTFTISEVDSYVAGDDNYRTDITVTNNARATQTAILYHVADCTLQGSDYGYGFVNSLTGGPSCTADANDQPPGQVEEFSPITPGIHYVESQFPSFWSDVETMTDLPDMCDCTTFEDNGMGINWDVSLGAGASATYSMVSNFSPTGQLIGQPAVVSGTPNVTSSTTAVMAGSVNPSGANVTSCQFQWGLTTAYGKTAPCLQSVGAGSAPVNVTSAPLTGLTPGLTYHFRLVATNSRGTSVGADSTITPPLPPTIGKTADVFPVSGTVYVKPPHGMTLGGKRLVGAAAITKGQGFQPLSVARQIPAGSQIDARRGTLNMVLSTGKKHKTQTATLNGGIFNFTQAKHGISKGLTTFTLRENAFKGAPSYSACSVHKGLAGIARLSKKILQTLHARDKHGKFRTRGRYAAATVRGTWWWMSDRCDGTFTYVKRGKVSVRDFKRRKTVLLSAGHGYLAKAH
jgi:hypothetical protein